MTKKQVELYEFIKEFALANNFVPSFNDIIKQSKIYKSKASVHDAMVVLEDNGFISYPRTKASRNYVVKGLKIVEV